MIVSTNFNIFFNPRQTFSFRSTWQLSMSSTDKDNIERRANEGEEGRTDQADCKAQENTTCELTPVMADAIAQLVFEKLVAIP